ncbi:uridine kinase [Cellulomonas sp.]|uniref:uridine kinase n=1 Tax=Cellulomonas sp. TaxID=40001 RepID=UPI00258D29F6|nr:uridine kinase [Cellulomonas sp.]MCR6688781.1 uridine kinase [Cellulomonas sp.]
MTPDQREVVDRVLDGLPTRRRGVLAIDGIGASGKSTFAGALVEHVAPRAVALLHADDFFRPADVRHARGRFSPEGFWLDTYDHDRLTAAVRRAGADGTLVVVEGTFLLRDELVGLWDRSVYLDVPFDVARVRMRRRGGLDESVADLLLDRYEGAQRIYHALARPWERASVVVDTTEPARPRVIDPSLAHAAGRSRG